jgi:hypothetical protein
LALVDQEWKDDAPGLAAALAICVELRDYSSMTYVFKHALRMSARMSASFRPEGWSPKLKMMLHGPAPAGAELVWTVARPDGSPWFEHRVSAPELPDAGAATVDLQRWEDGGDLAEPGTVAFSLRLVSDLDGVDEVLHDGSMTVVALEGAQRYAVDNDWILGLALVCLDTVDEHDAPKFKVTTFLKGDVDAYQLEAHCFHNGRRIAKASYVESRYAFTANDGAVVGHEIRAVFDDVRGWNNLSDSGWGGDWHLLDAHDGAYEVKLLRESKVTRVIGFTVVDGRIVAPGVVEVDPWTGPVIFVDATVLGGLDGAWASEGSPAFYGDPSTAAAWTSIDGVYAQRVTPEVEEAPAFDDATATALQAFLTRAALLINTWESIMIGPLPPFDYDQVLKAEAVSDEQPSYTELRDAAVSVPDSQPVELDGELTTVGDLRARMHALFVAAEARITGTAQAHEDELAPYRALLSGDKLAIFEDHPANAFLYTTTDRRVIETPEELAEAEYWYFEGPFSLPGTASVDGVEIKVTVQGWRVLGWQFDSDGAIVDEFETQGQGSSAPKSAFQRGD